MTWKTARLDECCTIVAGATPATGTASYWDGDICWATPKDLSNLVGPCISDTPRKITRAGLASCAASVLPVGTVLFSSRAPIGHVAINTVPMATNQGFKNLAPKPDKAHAQYLYHWLRANRAYLEGLGNGATFKEVSKAVVSRVEVPLPPLAEQRRIAAILDQAETLRAQRRAAIAQLDSLGQAVFLTMFGDPVSNRQGWPSAPLPQVCHCYSGGTPSKVNVKLWQGSLPWFSAKDLKAADLFDAEDHIAETVPRNSTLKLLPADTVAIVVRGMILAHTFPVCILRIPATINQDLKALLPRTPVDPQFLAFCLRSQSKHVLNQVSEAGHGTKRLDAQGLEKIRVLLPPAELQEAFAQRILSIEDLQAVHRAALTHLNELFASLQHRAFRGQL